MKHFVIPSQNSFLTQINLNLGSGGFFGRLSIANHRRISKPDPNILSMGLDGFLGSQWLVNNHRRVSEPTPMFNKKEGESIFSSGGSRFVSARSSESTTPLINYDYRKYFRKNQQNNLQKVILNGGQNG